MKTLLACLTLLAAAAVAPAAPPAPVGVTFRLASPDPVPGWEAVAEPGGGRTWHLAPEVLLDQTAFAAASALPGEGGTWIVDIQLNEAGRRKFAQVTGANVGRSLAIVVDGRPVSVPVIHAAVTEGRAVLRGGFSAEQARALAAAIVAAPASTASGASEP